MRVRAALLAAAGALASFDAFAQDPYAKAFGAIFFVVGAGFLACVVVELSAGRGGWAKRAAIGVAFAFVNCVSYLVFVRLLIDVSIAIAPGPSESASGPLPVILIALAAWVIPAWRLWWLRRHPPVGR